MSFPNLSDVWMDVVKMLGIQIGHSVHNYPTSIMPANVTHICTVPRFPWTSNCICSKCCDQNFGCSQQKPNRAKIVQNIFPCQDRIWSTYKSFVFKCIPFICMWRNVIVFLGLRLNGLGSISKWNQIHNQLEDARIHLLLRSRFFEWTRFLEGKLCAKSVDKCESRILFSGKNQISPSEGGF